MGQVVISINNREYAIATEDGQEGRILELSRLMDEKAKSFGESANHVSENMILTMVGLMLADDLVEKKKKPDSTPEPIPVDKSGLVEIDNLLSSLIKKASDDILALANKLDLL